MEKETIEVKIRFLADESQQTIRSFFDVLSPYLSAIKGLTICGSAKTDEVSALTHSNKTNKVIMIVVREYGEKLKDKKGCYGTPNINRFCQGLRRADPANFVYTIIDLRRFSNLENRKKKVIDCLKDFFQSERVKNFQQGFMKFISLSQIPAYPYETILNVESKQKGRPKHENIFL